MMTIQSADLIIYQEDTYDLLFDRPRFSIIAQDPRRLPMLKRYGFRSLVWCTTATYRGYQATYTVINNTLCMTYLEVGDTSAIFPPIGGVLPRIEGLCAVYENMEEKLPYSGIVAIGKDCQSKYGYHILNFRTVKRLEFRDGLLTNAIDISSEVALIREKIELIESDNEPDSIYQDTNLKRNETAYLSSRAHVIAGGSSLGLFLDRIAILFTRFKHEIGTWMLYL